MIAIRTFRPADLAALDLQPAQAAWRERADRVGYAESLAAHHAWTGEVDGRVVGCAGFVPTIDGALRAWALLGCVPAAEWTRIVRAMRRTLADVLAQNSRVEACVKSGFGPGCKLMRVLGFTPDGVMPFGRGKDEMILFSKVAG